jgi:hypothetical protein
MEKHDNSHATDDCQCGSGYRRDTRCLDCEQYVPSCHQCFINQHRQNFLHWVDVWDYDAKFYRRYNFCSIPGKTELIHLGHSGHKCSMSDHQNTFITTLVDLNGIHCTRVLYCACDVGWRQTRAVQLLRAGFFPASAHDPTTAFSTRLLKFYEANPQVATQFTEELRRVTDPAFPSEVPVSILALSFADLTVGVERPSDASSCRTHLFARLHASAARANSPN